MVGGAKDPVRCGIHQEFLGTALTELATPHVGQYLVRVSAIGPNHELRGTSFVQCESFASAQAADEPTLYVKFPLGAVRLPHISLNEAEKKSCSNRDAALAQAYLTLLSGSPSSTVFTSRRFELKPNARLAGHRWILRD